MVSDMTFATAKDWASRNKNILFFIGGLIFHAFTLIRIDSVIDLVYQSVYLGLITLILVRQVRLELGLCQPSRWTAKLLHYETEAIHWFSGGPRRAFLIV